MSTGNGWDNNSLASTVFRGMKHDDPVFREIKTLLQNGRRAEAINLIRQYDNRFDDPEAKELMKMIMNTLSDTMIDP